MSARLVAQFLARGRQLLAWITQRKASADWAAGGTYDEAKVSLAPNDPVEASPAKMFGLLRSLEL